MFTIRPSSRIHGKKLKWYYRSLMLVLHNTNHLPANYLERPSTRVTHEELIMFINTLGHRK